MGHYMPDDEIRRRYRDMHPGYKRIQILADLNGCSQDEIKSVLKEGDVDMDEKTAIQLYNQGLNDREIGEQLGRHGSSVALWRKKHNLPPHGNKPKEKKPETVITKADHNSQMSQKGEAGPEVNPNFEKGPSDPTFTMEIPEKNRFDILCTKYPPAAILGQEVNKPVVERPSVEKLEIEILARGIDELKRENQILRAMLFGAGFDLNEFWQSEEEGHEKAY